MELTEQEMKIPCEGSNTLCEMPCLDQQEHKQDLRGDQNPSCLSPNHGQNDFQQALLPTSGIINQSQRQRVFLPEQYAVSSSNRLETKRKGKDKQRTHSILRFFKKIDPAASFSSNKEQDGNNLQDVGTLSLTSASENAGHVEEGRESILAWSYKVDEIDPAVVEELPPEIQEEVRAWLPPHKRPNIIRRGSSIAHYFTPTRKT